MERQYSFRDRVLALIARIPAGNVATYGQIAMLAGHPRRARHVGQALATLPPGHRLPWHRVITAGGRVAARRGKNPPYARAAELRQERLLRREGVEFSGGRVSLKTYRWEPVIDRTWGPPMAGGGTG